MEEVEAMAFYNAVTDDDGEDKSKEITLENATGEALTVSLTVVDRDYLMDQITQLPDAMLETLEEAEDPEEAEDKAEDANMISNVNGDTIRAFESICAAGMDHEELTGHHFEDMVKELDFEVLFPIGAEIIELSFENTGRVKDFHAQDSDKN